MLNKRKGISLIVLVITIIIIVILAGSVILTLSANNPINSANEAAFKSDLDAIESDLNMYQTSQYAKVKSYSPDKLDANDLTAKYDGTVIVGKTIKDIIPVLFTTAKYNGQFEVVNGKLVYLGTDRTKKKWAQDVNVEVIDADRLDAIISTATTLPISAGTNVVATIKISSNASINNINLINNLELLDQNNISVPVQPVFEISTPTGTQLDTLRTVDVTIKTDTLAEGIYKLKLKPYSISNIYDVTNSKDIVTGELFEIDNTPPTNPEMSAIPTGWTNLDVVVTITYPSDSVTKEYSLDGTTWNVYTNPITVNTNNTTIYARGEDIAGNQSGQSTMTIANIDKETPTVVFGTNGGNNLQVATTKVTVTDLGVSGIDITSLKYIWDSQNVTEPLGQWTTFANDEVINKTNSNGTYYLWIKALDNAGNIVITKSNAFVVDNIVPENPTLIAIPTAWTNINVTVTITYPSDAALKEYSTDGTTWNTYTEVVLITTNNTTVYARATDASGNQSGQSTMTVANIDKVMPTATYVTNGGTNLQTASTVVTASDVGGSNISSLEYIWDTQNVATPSSGWTSFTSGNTITKSGMTGTYYLWVKVVDNAGNSFVTKSNAFVADNTPPVNPTMSASPTGWTNGNVTVTITYSADAVVKEYSTNETTWSTYTAPVVVSTNNTTVYARATDASGNQSGQSTITVANIDKTAPSVPIANFNGYTPGTWTSANITLNLSSTDNGSGISKYQWSTNGTTWNDFYSSWLYNYDTVQTTCFRAVDNVGNVSGATIYYDILRDATAPVNPGMSASPTGWTNGNVTVTITYPGDANIKEYSTNGTLWSSYTAPVVVTNNITVYARGRDASGNQSGQSTITIANIDKTAPSAPNVNLNGYTSGTWTSSNVRIDLTSTDVGSGIQKYQYSHDGYNWTDIASSYIINYDCNYYITYRAIDNVGNISASAVTNIIQVDKLAPVNPTMSASPTGWTNGNVTVTITYSGDTTAKEYSTNGTSWNAYTAPVAVTNNATVYARGRDASGNQSGQSTITVTNIDKTVPSVPTVNLNGYTSGTWTSSDVRVDLTSTDDRSGIQKYQYSYDGYTWNDIVSSYIINYNYYYYITYRAIDNAGNASAAAVTNIIQVDKSAPSYSSSEIKNISSTGYDVYVYGVTDSGSGVNRLQFPTWTALNGQDDMVTSWWSNSLVTGQNLGGGTWKYTAKISEHNNEYGNYLTHIYLYDNLGNYTAITHNNVNVSDPSIAAKFTLTAAQEVFNGSTIYTGPGSVSNNYTIEFDAQPSDTIDVFSENNTIAGHSGYKHRFIIMESHGGGAPNAGLGVDLGTNGLVIIAHSAGYYHSLLTYYTNLNAWNHYKIVVENRVPRLYINGVLIKSGYAPLSSYTNLYTPFSIGTGSYGNFIGRANNFVFYNTVK